MKRIDFKKWISLNTALVFMFQQISPAFAMEHPDHNDEVGMTRHTLSPSVSSEEDTESSLYTPSPASDLTESDDDEVSMTQHTLSSSVSSEEDIESSVDNPSPALDLTEYENLKQDFIACFRDLVEKELSPCIQTRFIKYKEKVSSVLKNMPLRWSLSLGVMMLAMTMERSIGEQKKCVVKESQGEKLRSEFDAIAAELTEARFDVYGDRLLGEDGILKKINPNVRLSKIKRKAEALRYLSSRIGKNEPNDSEEIWNPIFRDFTGELSQYAAQTLGELYEIAVKLRKERATAHARLIPKVLRKVPHIKEGFVRAVATNLDESGRHENTNVTGSPLSKKKLGKAIACMDLCTHVYTDEAIRDFVKQHSPSIELRWNEIIKNKKEVERLYQNLLTIRTKHDELLQQNLIYERKGAKTIPSMQVPSLSREDQMPRLQGDLAACIGEINQFLQSLNRPPLQGRELDTLPSAIVELDKVQQNIKSEYSLYFSEEPGSTIPQFQDTDNVRHQLTNKAIVAASFLHKTHLSLDDNITVLDVGFRNLRPLKGIFYNVLKKAMSRKNNPNAWFEEWGEVDYIAYLKSDSSPKEKDKLFIVYSGSNSATDWVTNFTIGHTEFLNLSVHNGIGGVFTTSMSYEHPFLVDRLKCFYTYHRRPKSLEIVTTGHSLGGALASLAAYFYKAKQENNIRNVTGLGEGNFKVKTFIFGSPAIVNKQSKKIMEKELGRDNIFRVWNFEDLVVNLTNGDPIQRGAHIGTSYPLSNIENLKFDIVDRFWGPHGAKRYQAYLHALGQENLSSHHKRFTLLLNNYATSLQTHVEWIPTPLAARGNEAIYRKFLNGRLIYQPMNGGVRKLPIVALPNPLEGTFDVPGIPLKVFTGYRKEKLGDERTLEMWITLRFLVERDLQTTASSFQQIFDQWSPSVPVGIFWMRGDRGNTRYVYFISQNLKELSSGNLGQKWKCSTIVAGGKRRHKTYMGDMQNHVDSSMKRLSLSFSKEK